MLFLFLVFFPSWCSLTQTGCQEQAVALLSLEPFPDIISWSWNRALGLGQRVRGGPGGLSGALRPYGCAHGPDSAEEEEEGLFSAFQSALPINISCKVLISLCLEMLGVVRCSVMICHVIKREKPVLTFLVHCKGGLFQWVTGWFWSLDWRADQMNSKINNNAKKILLPCFFLLWGACLWFIKVFHFLQKKACW